MLRRPQQPPRKGLAPRLPRVTVEQGLKYTHYTYIVLRMGTKTISITDAAYARLAHEKRTQESFTDVILRLTRRRSLRELAKLVPTAEAEALAKAIESNRNLRLERRRRRTGR